MTDRSVMNGGGMAPRTVDVERKRADILTAAGEVFAERGFTGATVAEN